MPINVHVIPGTHQICLADDRYITPQCLKHCQLGYDKDILAIPKINAVLRLGNTVIDVGAYIGDTTIHFVERGCTVFAIEPREDAFACLLHNVPTAISIRRPAGQRGQRVSFHDGPLSHTECVNLGGRQVRVDGSDTDSLRCLSLDELNPHACHLIKIDAEGFEPHVLLGGQQLIQRTRPVLYIEVNAPALRDQGFSSAEDVHAILRGWAYKWHPVQHDRVGSNQPYDLVCIPE